MLKAAAPTAALHLTDPALVPHGCTVLYGTLLGIQQGHCGVADPRTESFFDSYILHITQSAMPAWHSLRDESWLSLHSAPQGEACMLPVLPMLLQVRLSTLSFFEHSANSYTMWMDAADTSGEASICSSCQLDGTQ